MTRHHRPQLKPVHYITPIRAELDDNGDILGVRAYVVIGDDTQGQWVGGYVRGCANFTEAAATRVLDMLAAKTRQQIHDLRAAR